MGGGGGGGGGSYLNPIGKGAKFWPLRTPKKIPAEACKPIELYRTEYHMCLAEKWHPGDFVDFTIICREARWPSGRAPEREVGGSILTQVAVLYP